MSIFFESQALLPAAHAALQDALAVDPKNITNPGEEATNRAQQLARQVSGQFSWSRLVAAAVLLVAIFAAGIYTEIHKVGDWGRCSCILLS